MVYSIFSISNQAIERMHEGNFKAAAALLLDGISTFEKAHSCTSPQDTMDCDYPYPAHQRRNNNKSRSVTYAPAPKRVSEGASEHNQSVFEAYEQPMSLFVAAASQDTTNVCLSERDYNVIHVVLLYNHGLCLHQQGLAKGSEVALEDALIVYEMALGLLGLLEDDEPFYFPVELALLNNYGQILNYFCDIRQVHDCLRRMHLVLHSATNAWEKRVPTEFSHFAHNIIYNGSQHILPAPAA